jgi:xylulokinase
MPNKHLSLGLDLSTQSITAAVLDVGNPRAAAFKISIDYLADKRTNSFGIGGDYILPPSEPGEAKQPALMFLAALDAVLSDLKKKLPSAGYDISDIAVVNFSAQQHGHVLLNSDFATALQTLSNAGTKNRELSEIFGNSLAVPFARIWRTSNTAKEAETVRERVGRKKRIIEITGSDAPLRFSAFGIMKTAAENSKEYEKTATIHQLNTFLACVLSGSADAPLDFGAGCGTSLMDYRARDWSVALIEAAGADLPGGPDALRKKLPPLGSALASAGTIAKYFSDKYGFSPDCEILAGSGDNPETKAPVDGTLLSLGTSFVLMAETDGRTMDPTGNANAMYDGLDRPFSFGCRTNGALRWDGVRAMHGLSKNDYAPAEAMLAATPPGNRGRVFLWQAEEESFPVSPVFGPVRIGYSEPDLAADYAGIVESTIGAMFIFSRSFMKPGKTFFVTGGPAESPEILRRVAAIFDRTVVPLGKGGAALGAAYAGAYAFLKKHRPDESAAEIFRGIVPPKEKWVHPHPDDARAYHGKGKYLDVLSGAMKKYLEQ